MFPSFCLTWSSSTSTCAILGIFADDLTNEDCDNILIDRHRGTPPRNSWEAIIYTWNQIKVQEIVELSEFSYWRSCDLFAGDPPKVGVHGQFRNRPLEVLWPCVLRRPLPETFASTRCPSFPILRCRCYLKTWTCWCRSHTCMEVYFVSLYFRYGIH